MNISLKKALLVFTSVLFFLAPATVLAQTTSAHKDKIVTVGKEETIEHDYFTAGSKVYVDGTIDGDAYIAGGQVDINGTIKGDLLVLGGQVTVRGTVMQNVRAIGGTVIITGTVGRNVSAVGGTITLEKGSSVAGNAALAGGTIAILSPLKSLNVAGGDIALSSLVTGDVVAAAQNLQLYSGSKVTGNVTYWSDSQAQVAPDATIAGAVSFNQTNFKNKWNSSEEKARKAATGAGVVMRLISFGSALIIGILLIKILPVFSNKAAVVMTTKIGKAMLFGLITLVCTPFAIILLALTILGIPLAVGVGLWYAVAIYVSKIFFAMAIGITLVNATKWKLTPGWSFLAGLSLFYLLAMVPVIGFFVKVVSLLGGLGALVLTKSEYLKTLREKKLL